MKRLLVRIAVLLLVAGAGAYTALSFTSEPVRNHPFFSALPQDRAVVFAHRGGADLWPENTLEAFHGAVALGSDGLELDVVGTSDGVPVVIHDETVNRTTNGTGRVADFTLEKLQELDAAFRFSPLDAPGTFPLRGQGHTVPTLREVFETFPGLPIIVEVKVNDPVLVDRVVVLVREFGRSDRTLTASFHQEVLVRFRRADARLATHLSQKEAIPFLVASWLFSGHLFSPPGEALLVPPRHGLFPVTTRRLMGAADRRNLFVAGWTINDSAEMKRLLERGVHGLITDRPDLAVSVVADAQYHVRR